MGAHLRLGRGEVANGGRGRPNTLCAAFEALIGAVYLDQGINMVTDIIVERFLPVAERVLQSQSDRDAKSLLQELTQAEAQTIPVYHIIAEQGPDHAKEFTVEVRFNGKTIGMGHGRSKQAAEQSAARYALDRFQSLWVSGDLAKNDG